MRRFAKLPLPADYINSNPRRETLMKRTFLGWLTVVLAAAAARADSPKSDLPKWLDERIAKIWPTASEKRFDEVGWATEILAARELAKKNNRPVFLFTHDGHMAVGRC
jgi:hypothetical protein